MRTNDSICFACSSGGHLAQLVTLNQFWSHYDRFWVTFQKPDAVSLLAGERAYWAYHPTNRHLLNLVRNTFLAISVLWKERPKVVVSTGAAIAVPFFVLGKLLGAKLIYIEVYDRLDAPTLTGRLVYPFTDEFLVQWEEQQSFYPKGKLWGQTL